MIIGATPEGRKELVGLSDGVRESAQSWRELPLDLKRRGLTIAPELAVADGALGFWQALEEVWPRTRGQRCWVHKTAPQLAVTCSTSCRRASNRRPSARCSRSGWPRPGTTPKPPSTPSSRPMPSSTTKRSTACPRIARRCWPYYDFPAEHWTHLRTSNLIESSFATVRHRTVRAKGCLSNKTALAMIFKRAQAAERSWHRLRGYNQLPKLILGVKFSDGIEVVTPQAQTAAA